MTKLQFFGMYISNFIPSLIIEHLCFSQILIFELFLISYPSIASNNKLSMNVDARKQDES